MTQVTWMCVACGFAIADGDGWVQARSSEVDAYQEANKAWEQEHEDEGSIGATLGELIDSPQPAQWRAIHSVCDATGGEPYALGVEDLRTPWQLVHQTAHLIEKNWFLSTDWGDVLRAKYVERER
jgi:hypothetical protein